MMGGVAAIRVLTYNVRSLRDDPRAVGRVIRTLEPDVACIQEAPRFWRWRTKCRRLAADAAMTWTCGGRDSGANIVLTSLRIDTIATRSVLFSKDPRLHQRGTVLALLRIDSALFAVAGIHLDGVEQPRLRHVDELHRAIDVFVPTGAPVIVAGDVNDVPGSRSWDALCARGIDAFAVAGRGAGETSNVTRRSRRIDAVFAGPDITVTSAVAVASDDVMVASDHLPVVCELEIPGHR
jgi:endonuclease/exonuclease/phosphatase family metal-dependent hydrolase